MPCTPIADKASRTSSSLHGLMMAVTSFMLASSKRLLSELVENLEPEGLLLVLSGAIGLQEHRLVGLVGAEFATDFHRLHRHVGERHGALLPFLDESRAISVLVVEILAAQRQSPLLIQLIVQVSRQALPLGLAAVECGLVLRAVVIVQDQRQLLGQSECADDVHEVAHPV